MAQRTKVKVGQKWTLVDRHVNTNIVYTIVRLDDKRAYATLDAPNVEILFAYIDRDGIPVDFLWTLWSIEEPKESDSTSQATQAVAVPTPRQTLYEFFSAVPRDHCACNVLRSECKFHR